VSCRLRILAIADDLTGALEVGAKFGRSAVITDCSPLHAPESGVLVIDTETRHVSAQRAREVVRNLMQTALPFTPSVIFKKTDSTLRGNIAAEFQGLLDALPQQQIVYIPAYPELGRTVRNGRLFVDGAPVEETAFARDSLNPVTSGNIAQLLAGVPAIVIDAETATDAQRAAKEILASQPRPIAAGPAGLASSLGDPATPEVMPRLERCLVVNGSLHPASAAQMEMARACGFFDESWSLCERDPHVVCAKLRATGFDGLVVFGGDTAYAIHRALGSDGFETIGEVLPGVPVSRSGGLTWITKAGGFGSPELLCDIRRRLT